MIDIKPIDPDRTGYNLYCIRVERGLKVREVCDRLHLSKGAVYKWERAESLPSLKHLLELSLLYRVKIEDILIPLRDTDR